MHTAKRCRQLPLSPARLPKRMLDSTSLSSLFLDTAGGLGHSKAQNADSQHWRAHAQLPQPVPQPQLHQRLHQRKPSGVFLSLPITTHACLGLLHDAVAADQHVSVDQVLQISIGMHQLDKFAEGRMRHNTWRVVVCHPSAYSRGCASGTLYSLHALACLCSLDAHVKSWPMSQMTSTAFDNLKGMPAGKDACMSPPWNPGVPRNLQMRPGKWLVSFDTAPR